MNRSILLMLVVLGVSTIVFTVAEAQECLELNEECGAGGSITCCPGLACASIAVGYRACRPTTTTTTPTTTTTECHELSEECSNSIIPCCPGLVCASVAVGYRACRSAVTTTGQPWRQ